MLKLSNFTFSVQRKSFFNIISVILKQKYYTILRLLTGDKFVLRFLSSDFDDSQIFPNPQLLNRVKNISRSIKALRPKAYSEPLFS